MQYVEGFDQTYPGSKEIRLKINNMVMGPGLTGIASSLTLDSDFMKYQAIPIIKEELKIAGLDLNQINKLLKGNAEDINVAYELLDARTKYTSRLLKAIRNDEQWTMFQVIREYVQNNTLNLSTEIL